MKTILSLFFATSFVLFGQDPPKEFERLETTKGKVYEHAKVRRIEPDGIAIIHDAGTAKVPFESLSADLQKSYGYDPTKAAEHRAVSNAAQAEAEAAADAELNAMAKVKSEKIAGIKNADVDKALSDRVKGMARKVSVDGFQVSNMGITADITVMKPIRVPVPGSMIQKENKWVFDRKVEGVISGTKGGRAVNGEGLTCIEWSGMAWSIGKIRYKTQQGMIRTCPLYTGSEDEAVEFFKKHGFTQVAVEAVRTAD